MRLLLDENVSSKIAEQLRARGHDAIALTEIDELRGKSDGVVLDWALRHDRGVVTYDTDLISLQQERLVAELPAAGLILIPKGRFPIGDRGFGPLVKALSTVLSASGPSARGRLLWLSEAGA